MRISEYFFFPPQTRAPGIDGTSRKRRRPYHSDDEMDDETEESNITSRHVLKIAAELLLDFA